VCCDVDGSCYDGNDDWCCNDIPYCSNDGAEYAEAEGIIECPIIPFIDDDLRMLAGDTSESTGGMSIELEIAGDEAAKDTPIYDLCGFDGSADYTTNWTVILAFNSIVFAVLAVCSVLMCLTCLVWPIGYVGAFGNCLGCCAYLAAIIVTGVFRYSTEGKQCVEWASSDKAWPYDLNEDGDSFNMSDHADAITGLFIA